MSRAGQAPTTDELLARLPPLPDVKRPLFQGAEHLATGLESDDVEMLEEMISGRFLDFMLAEVLDGLPHVAERVRAVGSAGVVLQARPSNTLNALTVPTRDGVVVIYNLGLYSMLYSVAAAVAAVTAAPAEESTVVQYLAGLVDWATSRALEPRTFGLVELPPYDTGLAANIASRGQRFALCHELGHVTVFDPSEVPSRRAAVEGITVAALRDSWDKEYAADRDGLLMYLRLLQVRGQQPVSGLIGGELFLNVVGMLQESTTDTTADSGSHPPPDERLSRVRQQFLDALGERAAFAAQPAIDVAGILSRLRPAVGAQVLQRRVRTARRLAEAFATTTAAWPTMTHDERRAGAQTISRFLLESPAATLDFLHSALFAPREDDEPDGGGPARLLALNASLHFEKPLQEALDLSRLYHPD